MNTELDFSDLEDELVVGTPAKPKNTEHVCDRCMGSGEYTYGYVNIRTGKCHACKGKGFFTTSKEQRIKSKASYQKSKNKKEAEAAVKLSKFIEAHEDLYNCLNGAAGWSEFARSLLDAVNKYGELSDKQFTAATNMMNKMVANQKSRDEEKAKELADKPVIDLTAINKLFSTALSSGLKKPALVIGSLRISIAPASGKNAGCLYVKDGGEYAGKILPEGKFINIKTARKEIEQELIDLSSDPLKAAVKHGRVTGQCACCSRQLTNKESIELGIGPICREKWGM
jgi:hypothetical protein